MKLPHSTLACPLSLHCSGLVCAAIARRNSFTVDILTQTTFLLPLSSCILNHKCRSCNVDASTGPGLPMIHWSLHCIQLQFSVIVASLIRDGSYTVGKRIRFRM